MAETNTKESASHNGRSGVWVWAAVVCLLVAVGIGVWWFTRPPKITPPLAVIPLPDGTELRLVGVMRGPKITFDQNDTFEGRVRTGRVEPAPMGFRNFGDPTWLIFTHFDPRTGEFKKPLLDDLWLVEGSPPYRHHAIFSSNPRSTGPSEIYYWPVVPRRSATWTLEVNYRGMSAQGTVPNLLPMPPIQEFKPLPQKVTVEQASLELLGFSPGTHIFSNGTRDISLTTASPDLKVSLGDLGENDFHVISELFDGTGNVTSGLLLPFSEPAWGVSVRLFQKKFTTAAPGKVVSLGETSALQASQKILLDVPSSLVERGVTDLILVGPGNYRSADLRRASSENDPTDGIPVKVGEKESCFIVVTQMIPVPAKPVTGPSTSIADYQARHRSFYQNDGLVVQLRSGDTIFPLPTDRNGHWGSRTATYSLHHFKFPTPPAPDAKFRVEYLEPKMLEATFFCPPPDPAKFGPRE